MELALNSTAVLEMLIQVVFSYLLLVNCTESVSFSNEPAVSGAI